jgi:uncharacterized protein (TIGR02246 family)
VLRGRAVKVRKHVPAGTFFASQEAFPGEVSQMNSKPRLFFVVLAAAIMVSNLPPAGASNLEADRQAILALISRMEAAWNRGDFRGYMEGFANPDVVFVSRGQFQKDWQGTLDHYIRDYGASDDTRGRLRFFDIQIEILAPDTAQLISRYQLDRPQNPQDGINTRLMRKRGGKWVIALNHVSSREIAGPECACD